MERGGLDNSVDGCYNEAYIILIKRRSELMKEEMMIPCTIKSVFCGSADETAHFLTEDALLDRELWKKFVQAFRDREDGKNLGWRGEYWGKMMRGAAMLYAVTRNDLLYDVMTETVRDLLTIADPDGRVSSYTRETELDGWDMWCRKYVLLGLEYYYNVCRCDALKEEIISFL